MNVFAAFSSISFDGPALIDLYVRLCSPLEFKKKTMEATDIPYKQRVYSICKFFKRCHPVYSVLGGARSKKGNGWNVCFERKDSKLYLFGGQMTSG